MMNASREMKMIFDEVIQDIQEAEKAVKKLDIEFPGMPAPGFYLEPDKNNTVAQEEIDKLEKQHDAAMTSVGEQLELYLAQMMSANWGWEGGARDIIDTGQLMASGNVTVTDGNIDIQYASPYAAFVHYGGYIHPYGNKNIEKKYLPGRPWISAALGEAGGPLPPFSWEDAYKVAMRQQV